MLTVRPQDPSLIKERSSHPPDHNLLITQHSHLVGPLCLLSFQSSFPRLRVHLPVLVMCVLMTHIGFGCIWCVVIILHLSSWSDDPCLFLSLFNPYLSDPLTLLLLIHLSHSVVLPFSRHHCCITNTTKLSHCLITVTRRTSHTLGTINV